MSRGLEQERVRLHRAFVGRFGFLLAALIALLMSTPLILDGWAWNLALDAVAGVVLVAALHAALRVRSAILAGLVLAAIDFGMGRLAVSTGVKALVIVQVFLWLGTLAFVTATILEGVLRARRVTMETLQAAICVYLLLGLLWTFLYATLDVVAPGEFHFTRAADFRWTNVTSRRAEFLRLFFLSYSTLSTVGGGGVDVSGWFVRMMACIEAMTGQIYIGLLIARLVGIHIMQDPNVALESPADRSGTAP